MNSLIIKNLENLTIKIEKDTIYIYKKYILKPLPIQRDKLLPNPLPKPLLQHSPKPLPKQYISCLQFLHDKLKENI